MTPSAIRFSAALIGVLAAACYPVRENPPSRPRGIAKPSAAAVTIHEPVTSAPQADAILPTPPKPTQAASTEKPGNLRETTAPITTDRPAATEKATTEKPSATPTAQKAPGREGYVLSPYTGKLMFISGIPSGTIVPDQTCPPSEKKFFRVP